MGLGVGLSIDKLNLDGYMPAPSAGEGGGAAAAEAKTEAGGNPLKALAPLADYNANVDIRAGSLTLNEQQISGLRLVATVAGGALDVTELSVKDFQGGKANIAAKVTDLKGDPEIRRQFRRHREGRRQGAADGRHGRAAQGQVRRADPERHRGRHADRRHL